jgi:membrane protease subunit HflK
MNSPFDGGGREGPPDLYELIKRGLAKLFAEFNNFKPGFKPGFDSGNTSNSLFNYTHTRLSLIIIATLVFVYVIFGFYIISPAESGVLLRLGCYHRTVAPGPHWRPLLLDNLYVVNTENIRSIRHVGKMLTKDENLLTVEIEVQYQITNVKAFLFQVHEPEHSLSQALESALRQVVGMNNLDFIITSGRADIEEQTAKQLTSILELYQVGLTITAVNLKDVKAPNQVKAAFDDVTRAREDRERFLHEAEAYYNKIVPEARGMASKLLEEARAYKQEQINTATGDADQFSLLVPEYLKAPKLTKQRLSIDMLKQVLGSNKKVIMDFAGQGNTMTYLPLEQLLRNTPANNLGNAVGSTQLNAASLPHATSEGDN